MAEFSTSYEFCTELLDGISAYFCGTEEYPAAIYINPSRYFLLRSLMHQCAENARLTAPQGVVMLPFGSDGHKLYIRGIPIKVVAHLLENEYTLAVNRKNDSKIWEWLD